MIDRRVPVEIGRSLTELHNIKAAVVNPPGLSGAMVFRCNSESGAMFALRRWPKSMTAGRVAQIHQVIACAATKGCAFVPRQLPLQVDGQCWRVYDGYVWDLSCWVQGTPAAKIASLATIQAGAAAIGKFHCSVEELTNRRQQAPAIVARLRRAEEIDGLMPRLAESNFKDFPISLARQLRRAFDSLRLKWGSVHQEFSRSIGGSLGQPMWTQYVLRDVHREHVLFTGSQVTGLVDFDAIRVDTPVADLVRWGGGFLQDRENIRDVWVAVLAGHQCESSSLSGYSSDEFVRLANQLHRISLWISLANWLNWLTVEKRIFAADDEQICQRIKDLADLADADLVF